MLNFRSIYDLNQTIVNNLHKLPRDIGLIVGIPRSGLLAANLIALHLNLPMTDLDGLTEGRIIDYGNRIMQSAFDKGNIFSKKILVVDDSVLTSGTMIKAKQTLSEFKFENDLIYCAIYTASNTQSFVDIFFEIITGERVFEWNVMHSKIMTQSCVDIDGVLCVDPTEEENDDGHRYQQFLINTSPLRIPSVKIKCLVTCRLEKYRSLTEKWLLANGVEYDNLIMMDLPSKEARQSSGAHASFKAAVYKKTNAKLFIESNKKQANEITKISNKPVLCMDSLQMVYPSVAKYAVERIYRNPLSIYRRVKTFLKYFGRNLLYINPPKNYRD